MKTALLIVLSSIVVVIVLTVGGFVSIYNHQISLDEQSKEKWGNVETDLQRRADLIPNLVNTVKAYAAHEQQVLIEVTEARQQVNNIQLEVDEAGGNIPPNLMEQYMQAQSGLSGALSRLLVTVEKYPDLKANQNFLTLQHQLEGTENRIGVSRKDYNKAVASLNSSVRGFFGKIVAGFSDVEPKEPFEAMETVASVPVVTFD